MKDSTVECEAMRAKMPEGPWMDELCYEEFTSHGFKCFIIRVHWGFHLCGYVGVPKTHIAYQKQYDDIRVDVHGGLTFSDKDNDLWVVGFDCAHYQDLVPFQLGAFPHKTQTGTYRDMDYVKKEVESLAKQLSELQP